MENKENEKQYEDFISKFSGGELKEELTDLKRTIISDSKTPLEYLHVDINMLPLGRFYRDGTQIKIRAAKVYEVQAYSVVDDKNFLDVTEKMNQMLSGCVKFIHPGGKMGSYKDLKDGDRLFLIFMIRELTFQRGQSLAKDITCEYCNNEFKIPFRATSNPVNPKTFVNHEMPENLAPFFSEDYKAFVFDIAGVEYKIAPPTIGIQEIFFKDVKDKVNAGNKNPNISFLKIIPFMLFDRNSITEDGIKKREDDFKRMDMDTFLILNTAVDNMILGLKGLKMECPECGSEVHTDMTFPKGASSIFVSTNPFDDFIKK